VLLLWTVLSPAIFVWSVKRKLGWERFVLLVGVLWVVGVIVG